MKKILIAAVALIAALTMSLTACDTKKRNERYDDDDDIVGSDDLVSPSKGSNTTGAGTTNGGGSSVTSQWTEVGGKVYVLTRSNIRSSASTASTKLGEAELGTSFDRLATNGTWTKISYNGAEAYIMSDLTTTDSRRATFTPKEGAEQITLHIKASGTSTPNGIALRSAPTAAEIADSYVGTVTETQTNDSSNVLKLLAVTEDGSWAKVSYTGKDKEGKTYTGTEVLYCTTAYFVDLSTPSGGNQGGAAG